MLVTYDVRWLLSLDPVAHSGCYDRLIKNTGVWVMHPQEPLREPDGAERVYLRYHHVVNEVDVQRMIVDTIVSAAMQEAPPQVGPHTVLPTLRTCLRSSWRTGSLDSILLSRTTLLRCFREPMDADPDSAIRLSPKWAATIKDLTDLTRIVIHEGVPDGVVIGCASPGDTGILSCAGELWGTPVGAFVTESGVAAVGVDPKG
jgi:hypothetical protein